MGVYELGSIIVILLTEDIRSIQSDFLLLNADLVAQQKPVLYLLITFVFFLGINRVTWALAGYFHPQENQSFLWWNLIILHSMEYAFFLKLAMEPHFNTTQEDSWISLYHRVLTLQLGNHHSRNVLVVVPLLITLLLIHGSKAE